MTEKFHEYLYGNSFEVVTDNNPLTYVFTSAKLDATGHRWLASLSNYNFSLCYRKGAHNANADGLSRRPQDIEEVTPDVVSSICSACTIDRSNCPYLENIFLPTFTPTCNSVSALVHSNADRHAHSPSSLVQNNETVQIEDTCLLSDVNWAKEQHRDKTIRRVIDLLQGDYLPSSTELKSESADVCKYFRESDKLYLQNGVIV